MPPVVAAIVTLVGIYGFTAVAIGVVMVAAIGYSAYAMATMPDMPGYSAETRGRTQVVRSAVTPHRIIYGEIMVSGPLVAAFSTGDNNKFIYLVIVLAAHEVEEIGEVWFGDTLASDPKFQIPDPIAEIGHFNEAEPYEWIVDAAADPDHTRPAYVITKHLGHVDQLADTDLMADARDENDNPCWTENHRLRGRAYIVVKLEYDTTVFPQGIPNIKAVVKGAKDIYDPRTETSGYSTNWALCCRDYLAKTYGLKCEAGDISEASFIAGANICDESMAVADRMIDGVLTAQPPEARYTMNGCFSLDGKPIDIMKKMLTGAVGQLVWSQGQYSIFPAAYNTPVARPLTVSDLRGAISVMPAPSRKNKINTVRGTFVDPAQFWQQIDFPMVQVAGAYDLDLEELVDNIELPYTTSGTTAQRLATIHLNRGLLGITVTFPGKLTCFRYQPQDVIPVTIPQLAWSNKLFRATNWGLSEEGGVDLVLREESPDVYGWLAAQAVGYVYPPVAKIDWPPKLTLAAPTGLVATGGALQVSLSWIAVAGATSYNIYWSTTSGVTKSNGTKIPGAFSGHIKTGLTAATPYYFVVTSFDGTRESADSAQATATTT